MDDEALRELMAQREREALEIFQQRQQQQQLETQQRRESLSILQHQLNQALAGPASLLSRARSPGEPPVSASVSGASGLEQLLTNPRILARSPPELSAPAPAIAGFDQLLANQRRRSSISSQAIPFASTSVSGLGIAAGTLGSAGRQDLSSLAVSQEIKRLQELQQQELAAIRPPAGHPFSLSSSQTSQSVLPSSSLASVDPNAALLRQQWMETSHLPNLSQTTTRALGGNLPDRTTNLPIRSGPINELAVSNQSILESQLLQEARMLMRPNDGMANHPRTLAATASTALPRTKAPSPLSSVPPPSTYAEGNRKMRGGVIEPFPEKLHRLLLEVELTGRSDIISFVSEGRAFAIHKSEDFFRDIVPLYFKQSRLSSFKRQLNLYGFELITSGPSRGAYYHELFRRDQPELCRRMRRVAVKVSAAASSSKPSCEPSTGPRSDRSDVESSSSASEDEADGKKVAGFGGDGGNDN